MSDGATVDRSMARVGALRENDLRELAWKALVDKTVDELYAEMRGMQRHRRQR